MPLRVIVCGSRNYGRLDVVRERTRQLPADAVLIVGGARGPDEEAERVGWERGMDVRVFLPDWKKHPRAAGHRRNADMELELERGEPTDERLVIAFHDGSSRGTAGMVRIARERGIDVELYGPDGVRV